MWGRPADLHQSLDEPPLSSLLHPSLSLCLCLTSSLSIIPRLKNRPMFLTEPCPLNLISKTEIEGGACLSPCRQSQLCVICWGLHYVWPCLFTRTIDWQGGLAGRRTDANLSFTLWNVPPHRFLILLFFFLEEWIHEWLMCCDFRLRIYFVCATVTASCRR